jgi:replication factor C large subunit
MSQLFPDKYMPKNFDEFIGNIEIVETAKKWAQDWQDGKSSKPLLFFGTSGTGKTALAYLIAKEMNWQIFEMNSSDIRNKDAIERIVGSGASNSTLFGSKRLILIDEVDALQSQDRGGSSAITSIIKTAKNPIILTANDVYGDKKLVALRSLTQMLEFKKINYLSIAKKLREVCDKENIEYDPDAVKQLAKNSGGDFRSALLDVQSLSDGITMDLVNDLYPRMRKEKIFSVMGKVFKGHNLHEIRQMVDNSEVSSDLLLRWVEENVPRQYEGEDVAKAFNYLSRGDIFQARIFKRQHYGFLKYVYFLSTIGVSFARSKDYGGWKPFQFPTLLSSLSASTSKRAKRKEVAKKISVKTHCSIREAIGDIPYIQSFFTNKEVAKSMTYFFEFDENDLAFIMNTKKDTKKVQKLIEEAKEIEKKSINVNLHGAKQTTLFN